MRQVILGVALVVALALFATTAFAGQIWTDGDGDGLPDPGAFYYLGPFPMPVAVDVWIDTQSFAFTAFQCWINNDPCMTFQSASFSISGGTNVVVQTVPGATGLNGSEYRNRHGVIKIGQVQFLFGPAAFCCITPRMDQDPEPHSLLTNGSASFPFETAARSCWETENPSATEKMNWGALKGVYR